MLNQSTKSDYEYYSSNALTSLKDKYCLCDVTPNSPKMPCITSSYADRSHKPSINFNYHQTWYNVTKKSNIKKSRENMQVLRNYKCTVEQRKNIRGGITTVYTCKYDGCNKEFTRTWSILDHVRMHEGIRPYTCPYCSRSYTQKGNMIKHMRRHTEPDIDNRRLYVWEFCHHGYTEKYNLKVRINLTLFFIQVLWYAFANILYINSYVHLIFL